LLSIFPPSRWLYLLRPLQLLRAPFNSLLKSRADAEYRSRRLVAGEGGQAEVEIV
jgi:hypothetical protein